MSLFIHSPDDSITIDDGMQRLEIPLAEFLIYEPAYTLPAPYITRYYEPSVRDTLSTGSYQIGGVVPWPDGDSYIANLTSYINQHNNPPRTLNEAKTAKKDSVTQLNKSKKIGHVLLFTTEFFSGNLDASQLISYNALMAVPMGFYIRDVFGVNQTLDLSQFNTLNDGIVQLHQLCDVNADSLKDAIDLLGSIAAVDAFDITAGWPTIPYTPV